MSVKWVRSTLLGKHLIFYFSAITRFSCDEDIANQTFCSDVRDKSGSRNITLGFLRAENISKECDKFTVDLQNRNLEVEVEDKSGISLPLLIGIVLGALLLLLGVIVYLVYYGVDKRDEAVRRPQSIYRVTKKDLEEEGKPI